MPITKSAKKALRQSLRRKDRNLIYKKKIKSLLKEVRNLVSQKKVKEDKSSFPASLSRAIAKEKEESLLSSPSQRESSAIEEAKKLLPQVYKILDKAAKVGVIKKNTAARKKSRITKLITKSR
jgi:small subunit ribosomal protein S20